MRRSRDKQPSQPSLKKELFKMGAILTIGASALTGCGANEATANSPTETQPTATATQEETTVSIAELDGTERVPYTYSSAYEEKEGGPTELVWNGVPEEFREVHTIDDLVGTEEEIAEKFRIPAGLSADEIAQKFIDNVNYAYLLSSDDTKQYNLLPVSFVVEAIIDYDWGDDLHERNDVLNAIGDRYYEAANVMFADNASNSAKSVQDRLFRNGALTSISLSLSTDNKREDAPAGNNLQMFYQHPELVEVVSSEEYNGKSYVTFKWVIVDNRGLNEVDIDPDNPKLYTINPQKEVDGSAPEHRSLEHVTTLVVKETSDGRTVIEDFNNVTIEEGQETVK